MEKYYQSLNLILYIKGLEKDTSFKSVFNLKLNITYYTMSKIPIASTPQYVLIISLKKNRAYLKIIGFWRNPEMVPNYIEDWKKAVTMLSPGFTLLTDAREMVIHPGPVRQLHEQAQKLIVDYGVSKVAELQKNVAAELQLNGVASGTRLPKKNFFNQLEAEDWLSIPVEA